MSTFELPRARAPPGFKVYEDLSQLCNRRGRQTPDQEILESPEDVWNDVTFGNDLKEFDLEESRRMGEMLLRPKKPIGTGRNTKDKNLQVDVISEVQMKPGSGSFINSLAEATFGKGYNHADPEGWFIRQNHRLSQEKRIAERKDERLGIVPVKSEEDILNDLEDLAEKMVLDLKLDDDYIGEESVEPDKYSGIMTEREKQQLLNQQMSSLQSLDGCHDYYYQMKKGRVAEGQRVYGSRPTAPPMAGAPKHEVEFLKRNKDVLGMRSFFPGNVLSPRKVVEANVSADFKQRWVVEADFFRDIEMYNCILVNFEKVEQLMSGPKNGSNPEFVNLCLSQAQALDALWKMLQQTTTFIKVISNPTGKILLCRMIMRIGSKERRYTLLGMLINHFRNFISSPVPIHHREVQDQYEVFRKEILTGSVLDLLQMGISNLKRYELKSMASSQLGITILLAILHQAEKIINSNTFRRQVRDDRPTEAWRDTALNIMLAIMCQQRQHGVSNPLEMFENVIYHAMRYLENGHDVEAIVDLYRKWTIVGVPMVHGNLF